MAIEKDVLKAKPSFQVISDIDRIRTSIRLITHSYNGSKTSHLDRRDHFQIPCNTTGRSEITTGCY